MQVQRHQLTARQQETTEALRDIGSELCLALGATLGSMPEHLLGLEIAREVQQALNHWLAFARVEGNETNFPWMKKECTALNKAVRYRRFLMQHSKRDGSWAKSVERIVRLFREVLKEAMAQGVAPSWDLHSLTKVGSEGLAVVLQWEPITAGGEISQQMSDPTKLDLVCGACWGDGQAREYVCPHCGGTLYSYNNERKLRCPKCMESGKGFPVAQMRGIVDCPCCKGMLKQPVKIVVANDPFLPDLPFWFYDQVLYYLHKAGHPAQIRTAHPEVLKAFLARPVYPPDKEHTAAQVPENIEIVEL